MTPAGLVQGKNIGFTHQMSGVRIPHSVRLISSVVEHHSDKMEVRSSILRTGTIGNITQRKSNSLRRNKPKVRILLLPLRDCTFPFGGVAQLEERRSPKPNVAGSSPVTPAISI